MNLVETIRETIKRHGLIPDDGPVVAAVSGGADSVALVRMLHTLGISCTVAHVNHQLRGTDSDADERFVRELAGELGYPFVSTSVDVQRLAATGGLSLEMAARQARHAFFAEFSGSVVALAHHADDQVETFILKLARGAGPDGLSGMSHRQKIGGITLVRPLLDATRRAIVEWLDENGFAWREDASNSDEAFLRNKVRHTILPLLESELNPGIRETILRTMRILRDENEWMNASVADCPSPLAELPLALRRRALRSWLFEKGADNIGFDTVDGILGLIDKGCGTAVYELNDHQRVVVEYGSPRFEDAHGEDVPEFHLLVEQGKGWRKDHGKGVGALPAEASFSARKVGDAPVEVRCWQPGDRMAPLGMEGTRKLQDILTDAKIPRAERSRIPVVVCRGEIIWLPGYRIARGWEVEGPETDSIHVHVEHFRP